MTTKIPVELSSTPGIVDGSNATAITIDSSENVGIGTTSVLSGNKLDVRGGNIMVGGFGNGTDYGLILTPDDGSGYFNIANITGGHLTFNNSATIGSSERMRIDSDGNLLLGTTTRLNNSNTIAKTTDHVPLNLRRDNGASDNSILVCYKSTSTAVLAIRGDGDVENTNNAYGALSDERLKSNIVDANSQLEDIKKVKVRNYTLDSTGETHIGVIAQELEAEGMNGLVVEREEGYKGVKYSILFMKAIKAIQEQQTQIEALQAEINTLKGE